jgi:hypothetical protein
LSHEGECPICHKTGKNFVAASTVFVGVTTTAAATTMHSVEVAKVEKHLNENEKPIWQSFVNYLKTTVVIDGFEVGFPSGLKVIFKIKQK